jgi:hypothetical protein
MSNDVFGYISPVQSPMADAIWAELANTAKSLGLGLRRIAANDLYGIRTDHLSAPDIIAFRITDGSDRKSASFLIDLVDYEPGSRVPLGAQGTERFNILLRWLKTASALAKNRTLVVVLTDANTLEATREIDAAVLERELLSDSQHYAPPNTAYTIVGRSSSTPAP